MMSQIQALQVTQTKSREKILEDVRSEFRFEKAKLMTEMERFINDQKKTLHNSSVQEVQTAPTWDVKLKQNALPPDFMKTSSFRNSRPTSNLIQNAERNLLNILNQALDPNEPFGPPLMRSAGSDDTNYELDISQMTDHEFKAELTRQYLIQKLSET